MPGPARISPQTLSVLLLLAQEGDVWHYGYEL
jgi:hypothetical protein